MWPYVVVAIVAVFVMITLGFLITCVVLCLRKSKTGDMETQKGFLITCVVLCLRKSKTGDMETQKGKDKQRHSLNVVMAYLSVNS